MRGDATLTESESTTAVDPQEELRRLRSSRDALRVAYEMALEERDQARRAVRDVTGSESYRLGRAAVTFVKNPVRTARRSTRRLASRARRYIRARLGHRSKPARSAPAPRTQTRLYLAFGQEDAGLRELVRAAAAYALIHADHRPVVVTDNPSFALLRNYGVLIEYVPDRQTFARHRGEDEWDRFLTRRLMRLVRDYRVDRPIVVDLLRTSDLPALIAAGESAS